MADVSDERITFGKLTKSHTQYGTTSSAKYTRVDNANSFIRHAVHVGDTLQGIAVKYGVAIEQIKRVNSLWTNDSLFLRDHLLIPVPCDSSEQQCVSGPLISDEQLPHLCAGFSKVPMSPQRHREKLQRSQTAGVCTTVPLMEKPEDDMNQVNISEYFSKYDTVLAKLKTGSSKIDSNTDDTLQHEDQDINW